jgi:hypothetical protein
MKRILGYITPVRAYLSADRIYMQAASGRVAEALAVHFDEVLICTRVIRGHLPVLLNRRWMPRILNLLNNLSGEQPPDRCFIFSESRAPTFKSAGGRMSYSFAECVPSRRSCTCVLWHFTSRSATGLSAIQ